MLRRRVFACSALATSAVRNSSLLTVNGLRAHREALVDRQAALEKQLEPLRALKQRLDVQAARHPDLAMGGMGLYLCAQTALLFHWVYFRFDWNLVEPITWLLGYSVTWLALAMYFKTGKEFTFDNIRSMMSENKRAKLYAANQFQPETYRALECELAEVERRVKQLSGLQQAP